MRTCRRCLYPENHPLGITFDKEGICSGCRIHEEKYALDWDARFEKLKKLTDAFRDRSGLGYDCIVPYAGTGDAYFTLHVVVKRLGLNPLVVRYNPHYNSHVGNRNYAYLKTLFDVDVFDQVVQPQKVKKITKATLKRLASIHWHVVAGHTVFPVQVAVRMKIPLIIWSMHQGMEQVGMFSHTDEVEMTRKYRKEHDLMGMEAEDLVDIEGLTEQDLMPFFYPRSREIERVGVRGIYLNNFIPWDSKAQHEEMIRLYGFETSEQPRTFDTYNTIGMLHYADLHDEIKQRKCGYGFATDHAVREIRWGRITKEEGAALAAYYHRRPLRYLAAMENWLDMSKEEIFHYLPPQKKKNASPAEVESILRKLGFVLTPPRCDRKEKDFILWEKGYVN